MKKMKLKKFMQLTELFLMLVLLITGCGKASADVGNRADRAENPGAVESETEEAESGASETETPESGASQTRAADSDADKTGETGSGATEVDKTENDEAEAESSEQMPSSGTDGAKEDRVFTIQGDSSPISFDMYTEEQNTKIGDDTIYTNRCVYPIITIEDHEDAAAKINTDIQERVASYQDEAGALELAEYDYDTVYKNGSYCPTYYDELVFTITRADSRVLSFSVKDDAYYGGPHGVETYIGLNYDVQTGELIGIPELSVSNDRFRESVIDRWQSLAASAEYQGFMYADAVDQLEELLYQDGRWYFSTSGLVFFSDPYEIAPFSVGSVEFMVPYRELDGMGMDEKYRYDGIPVIYLQNEESYFGDINGDGQEDEIRFAIDQPGHADTDVHFIINGIDFARQHAALSERFSGNDYIWCWTKCFLYDTDAQDGMTEIVFQMNHDDWEGRVDTSCMFIYRYEKDGSLTYLGRMEGDINRLALGW